MGVVLLSSCFGRDDVIRFVANHSRNSHTYITTRNQRKIQRELKSVRGLAHGTKRAS